MSRILIIVGHPRPASLSDVLAEAYADGAGDAGHEAETLVLRDLAFAPFATHGYDPIEIEPDLTRAQERIRWAEHVVWIWPLWYGLPPALVKAFIERAFVPGFATRLNAMGYPGEKLLTGRSSRIVVTMSMPWWFYRIFTGAHATRAFRSSILKLCGFGPIRETLFGFAHRANPATIERWRGEMRDLGRKAR